MNLPLQGIKVIEWSMYATGPLCGVMLADLGADVIRIEDPVRGGDPTRNMRYVAGIVDCQMPGNRNAFFEVMNWSKRSVTLNLKHPQGRALALRLLDQADVFILNIRPSVVKKLGLDYEAVRFSRSTVRSRQAAPELGEHNLEVLTSELRYSSEDVAEFLSAGALG